MVVVKCVRPFKSLFACPHTTASAFLPESSGAKWKVPKNVPFSDLTLIIKESDATQPPLSLRVHKAYLSRSEYFKVMLTSRLRESTQAVIEVEVPPDTQVVMLPLLAFLYDGVMELDRPKIDPAHVEAMWRLADYLQVEDLTSVLSEEMPQQAPPIQVVQGPMLFRSLFGCPHTTASAFLPGSPTVGWELHEHVPLSDLTLVIKESGSEDSPTMSLCVHKVCLSRCEYFKAMLTSRLRESTQPVIEVEVPPHTQVAMLPLLAYLYDGVIDLDMPNIQPAHAVSIWRLAHLWQIKDVYTILDKEVQRCPVLLIAAVEQRSSDGLFEPVRLQLHRVLSLSSPDLDPSVVSENMMDFLEHPCFLEVMSRYTPPTSEGGEWPSRESVLQLIVGRHIDEISDAGLASLPLCDLSYALWSQLDRPPCITDNQTGEVVLRWLTLRGEGLGSEDMSGLLGLLDLRQMSPDFVSHRLLAHPRLLACLDRLALATLHQLADTSAPLWRQIFCPVSKRIMLPEEGSAWAPVKAWTCHHSVSAAYALNRDAPYPSRSPITYYRGCPACCLCNGRRQADTTTAPADAMHAYLTAYFQRRQERYTTSRAWVKCLQTESEGAADRAHKKQRTGDVATGPSSGLSN